ncbi:hypothetical protein [Lacinutrix sp. Bg11-31]|uniref:hypothetical protein n=1 Tax=Lacinutrix sp. Bg11-31 TaxID=2057808 RepID=UPI000C300410|nr:hypothetical protein [Lacinutrix sp. Bg11-31]AUC80952.1 hypothetical protein CW733_01900 [Lacinutrix sp. Bg11-31]
MITTKLKTYKHVLLVFSFLLLASCKTYLAPSYNQEIITKSTAATTSTFQYFAAIAGGTNKESFTTRKNTYNTLIGQFETLKLLAKARPIPSNKTTQRINNLLAERNSPTSSSDYPSAFAFNRIVENLVKMKEKDQASGLNPIVIQAFKGEIEIFLDQAITYESFLKR